MTNDSNNYEEAVKTILEEIPEVNSDDVLKEFQRYHTDFGIPPEDAMRCDPAWHRLHQSPLNTVPHASLAPISRPVKGLRCLLLV